MYDDVFVDEPPNPTLWIARLMQALRQEESQGEITPAAVSRLRELLCELDHEVEVALAEAQAENRPLPRPSQN